MSVNPEYVLNKIFADLRSFEVEMFEIHNSEDRDYIIQELAKRVVYESNFKLQGNFLHLKNYKNFSIKKIEAFIMQIILEESLEILQEDYGFTEELLDEIKTNKEIINFLYELAKRYFSTNRIDFLEPIVESYFDLLDKANSLKEISTLANDAINGIVSKKSLFLDPQGSLILTKADQIWMRVKQAKKEKLHKMKTLQTDIKKVQTVIDGLKLNIQSIHDAKELSLEYLQAYPREKLRDTFCENTPAFLKERKLLSFVRAGEPAYSLEAVAEKGKINSKFTTEKVDYDKIMKFFQRCKVNNTDKAIAQKLEQYEEELPLKVDSLNTKVEKLEDLEFQTLDYFDISLKKIKTTMIKNMAGV